MMKTGTNLQQTVLGGVASTVGLFGRQQISFKINLVRKALENYLIYTTQQFQSIFVVALGANASQLGLVSGLGGIASSINSLPSGWVANKRGTRIIFMYGTLLMVSAALLFSIAGDWLLCIPAIILMTMGTGTSGMICSMMCGSCLNSEERATGMQICDSLSAIPRLAAPLVAAYLVMSLGGLTVTGIRPIFYLQLAGFLLLSLFVWKVFREPIRPSGFVRDNLGFFTGVRTIFNHGERLKTWLVYSSLSDFPYYMNPIFWPLYAKTVKGADGMTIAYMSVLMSVVPLLLAIPIGRWADSIGRKWVISITTILFAASTLSFILARGQTELLISALFQGMLMVMFVVRSTMNTERVPLNVLGMWLGVTNLGRGLVGMTLAPVLGGLIWTYLGPSYVYIFLFVVMMVSLVLLTQVPDNSRNPDRLLTTARSL